MKFRGREVWEGRDGEIGDCELGKWIFGKFMMGGSFGFGDLESEMKAGEGED